MPVFFFYNWSFTISGKNIAECLIFLCSCNSYCLLEYKKPMNFHTVNKLGWKIIMYFLKNLTIGRSGFFFSLIDTISIFAIYLQALSFVSNCEYFVLEFKKKTLLRRQIPTEIITKSGIVPNTYISIRNDWLQRKIIIKLYTRAVVNK